MVAFVVKIDFLGFFDTYSVMCPKLYITTATTRTMNQGSKPHCAQAQPQL